MVERWQDKEIKFIVDHLELDTKDIYCRFCFEFGRDRRSYDIVQKKVKKLRDDYGIEEKDPQEFNSLDRFTDIGD